MRRSFLACSLLFAFAAAPLAAHGASVTHAPDASDRYLITRISARRVAGRTLLFIASKDPLRYTVSVPFHLEDRIRLFVTLPGARLARSYHGAEFHGSGLMAVRAVENVENVRVYIDVKTLGDYGMETADGAVMLWLIPLASDASAVVAPAVPPITTAAPEAMSRAPAMHDGSSGRESQPSTAAPTAGAIDRLTALARRAGPALGRAASRAAGHAPSTGRAAAFVLLLLLPAGAWLLLRRERRPAAAPVPARTGNDSGGDARLWAARTMAEHGASVEDIARRTGLSRDATALLLRRGRATADAQSAD